MPARHPKRGRLWFTSGSSCIRLRPAYGNHVWAYDFVFDRIVRIKRRVRLYGGDPVGAGSVPSATTHTTAWTENCVSIRRINPFARVPV